jgi:hypothetical protein
MWIDTDGLLGRTVTRVSLDYSSTYVGPATLWRTVSATGVVFVDGSTIPNQSGVIT